MSNPHKPADVKYSQLRHSIGLLGLALPFLVRLHTEQCQGCPQLQDSISHYYYTFGNVWFIGILWGLGLSLIFYPTPDPGKTSFLFGRRIRPGVFKGRLDGYLTSLAGVFAICITLFPTNRNSSPACALFHLGDSEWRGWVHYGSAAGMLLIFSVMSVFMFPRTSDPVLWRKGWRHKPWKKFRNLLYVVCGIATFASIVTILLFHVLDIDIPNSTYWLEVCALVPFGISWLVKGGLIFTDPGDPSTVRHAASVVTKLRMASEGEDWFAKGNSNGTNGDGRKSVEE